MLKHFFPHLLKEDAYKIFYSSAGQSLSVANYWNDPHNQELYYEYNNFLPVLNNEKLSPSDNSSWQYRKTGITKLRAMVLIGGPDDGIIEPWQSRYVSVYADEIDLICDRIINYVLSVYRSHFAYFDANETVVPVHDQKFFINDDFGLKTLFQRKALHIFNVSGVGHHFWHRNVTVIKNYILPFLD